MFSASVFPELALSILAAYLIGSIPLAALISRIRGVDIFSTGTGLAGAANVLRNVGYIEGWIVFYWRRFQRHTLHCLSFMAWHKWRSYTDPSTCHPCRTLEAILNKVPRRRRTVHSGRHHDSRNAGVRIARRCNRRRGSGYCQSRRQTCLCVGWYSRLRVLVGTSPLHAG